MSSCMDAMYPGGERVNCRCHLVYDSLRRLHTSRQSDGDDFLNGTLCHVSDLRYLTPVPYRDMHNGPNASESGRTG